MRTPSLSLTHAWNHFLTTLRLRTPVSRLCLPPIVAAALMLTAGCETTSSVKTEADVIADMQSSNPDIAATAMQVYEKSYPTSTNGFAVMKGLLTDPRAKVRRKAARVLGILHAPVSQEDIDAICVMLLAVDSAEVIDALKSLRGLAAPSAVPKIVPLLNHTHPNVIRDACRTLAVLGTKDLIPTIEPLLSHSEAAVKQDAQDAIYKLRAK